MSLSGLDRVAGLLVLGDDMTRGEPDSPDLGSRAPRAPAAERTPPASGRRRDPGPLAPSSRRVYWSPSAPSRCSGSAERPSTAPFRSPRRPRGDLVADGSNRSRGGTCAVAVKVVPLLELVLGWLAHARNPIGDISLIGALDGVDPACGQGAPARPAGARLPVRARPGPGRLPVRSASLHAGARYSSPQQPAAGRLDRRSGRIRE